MSSNVHALELGRASKSVDFGVPDRAEVEMAFRTITKRACSRSFIKSWAGEEEQRARVWDWVWQSARPSWMPIGGASGWKTILAVAACFA